MILGRHVNAVPADRCAWIDEEGRGFYSDLARHDVVLPGGGGDRVALRLRGVGSVLRSLCALDGSCEAITLLSSTLAPSLAGGLAQKAGCTVVISDCDEASRLGGVPVLAWADLAWHPRSTIPDGPTQWILTTSGTTAEPKLVRYSLAGLSQGLKTDPSRTEGVRWSLLYDHPRFAGIHILLQSLLSGATLVAPALGDPPARRLDFLVRHGCTHVSATPSLWRAFMMSPHIGRLSPRHIGLGGEIADDKVLRMLRERFPEAGIRHVYGSTEAGMGFAVTDGRAGFPRSFLDAPRDGVEMKVRNGKLFIRRVGVETTYVDTSLTMGDEQGMIDTGDLVEVTDDRVFFLGRASGVINVGGAKVHPEAVEGVLMEHEAVVAAHVYARPNPITGSIVAADIVADPAVEDREAAVPSILAHARARLSRAEAPVVLRVVDRIEMTPAGKLARD